MHNYTVFEKAELNLATTPDKPIILISANNGGGKTSTLAAFRLALHGRRSFDHPISEREYIGKMASRFRNSNFDVPCSIQLDFDFLDLNKIRGVRLKREWTGPVNRISERLTVNVDNIALRDIEAEDFLSSIVPPEVAKFFFFDAERIKEMAEWSSEDEAHLFDAVEELLGINLLAQLTRDLHRIQDVANDSKSVTRTLQLQVEEAVEKEKDSRERLKFERTLSRSIRNRYDRAVSALRKLGGILAEELTTKREQVATLKAEKQALIDEAQRAAHDILPLVCGRTLRKTFAIELERRRIVDDREIVKRFLDDNHGTIEQDLKKHSFTNTQRQLIHLVFTERAHGKPLSVGLSFPSLSRTEEGWMHRVIERELPILEVRIAALLTRLRNVEDRIRQLDVEIQAVPVGDPKGEAAFAELEAAQRAVLEHEQRLEALENEQCGNLKTLDSLKKQDRLQRVALFQSRRLAGREAMIRSVIDAIPDLQRRLQSLKQSRFGECLRDTLQKLWSKQDRLTDVQVSFDTRSIDLFSGEQLLSKQDLSSAEKQLFATGFIYSLAKLSGRHMPFVIDTPVGRLDNGHRRSFVADFLPTASHQTILLSTDTEVVGSLYRDVRPYIARQYDLADYNDALTVRVELETA